MSDYRSSPLLPAVFGHDPPQSVDVAFGQQIALRRQILPRVPDGAEQLAADPVAVGRREEDSEVCAFFQRRAAFLLLLDRALIKRLADLLRPGAEHFIEQASVER